MVKAAFGGVKFPGSNVARTNDQETTRSPESSSTTAKAAGGRARDELVVQEHDFVFTVELCVTDPPFRSVPFHCVPVRSEQKTVRQAAVVTYVGSGHG